ADDALASGAKALADAEREVARGAKALDGASGRLSSSAAKVATGAAGVAAGAASLDAASGTLATGTEETATASESLASGSATLSSSAGSVDSGARQLSSGLAQGAAETPTYTDAQQTALADTVSQPVDLTHALQHDDHGNSWLLAAIVAVTLWVAALAGAAIADASAARRNALAPVASRRIAFLQVLPVLGIALVQAAAVGLGVWVAGVSVASVLPFALLTVLAAVCFTLIAFAMRLGLGNGWVAAFLLFLLLQVAALANVAPLETAPSVLRTLNGLMPLTAYVNAASQLASGGRVGSPAAVAFLLVVWALVAFALSVRSVRRRRVRRVGAPVLAGMPA
ncbi:hypothetical protein, partial [Marmoricola sp. RAF53]|uniref:hypothetical protein n=1 Tax=Marmoricola sp. RAF53 TaxID=3233059 RepID=UPI003F9974AA